MSTSALLFMIFCVVFYFGGFGLLFSIMLKNKK